MAEKLEFSQAELDALRKEYAADATPEQFTLWIEMCKRRRLTPVQDVVLQLRNAKEFDRATHAEIWVKKPIFITTMAALQKIALRSGQYDGPRDSEWVYLDDKNQPTIKSNFMLPDQSGTRPATPWLCRSYVKRKDFSEPTVGIARYDAYVQTKKDGNANQTWQTRGPEQLEKCAMALAYRRAFPEDTAGLYLDEEIPHDATAPAAAAEPPQPTTPPPALVQAPAVNHTPAEPRVEARPGEKKPRTKAEKQETAAAPATAPAEPAPVAPAPSGAMPSAADKLAYATRIRGYRADQALVKKYIVQSNNVKDWTELNIPQWEGALAKLDAAQTAGEDALVALLSGVIKETAA